MRIAFYAPLKPPNHPVPSGDRRMARLLILALRRAGHRVAIASTLRSYEGRGDTGRQDVIRRRATRIAQSYIKKSLKSDRTDRPDLWFTYHLYHKAPDLLGPVVSEALAAPYVVAEASFAPKQSGGPWRRGHGDVQSALRHAACIITLNPDDAPCVRDLVDDDRRLTALTPFINTGSARSAAGDRAIHRANLIQRHGLNPDAPWIAIAAMLRHGDKSDSYRILAGILARLRETPLQLLVAGDGPARADIQAYFNSDPRVCWLGETSASGVDAMHAAADLVVWPAVREAYGMALLEAQAAGVPVIAGGTPGVRQIVAHGETGLVVAANSPTLETDMTSATAALLRDPDRRLAMGRAALVRTHTHHGVESAACCLNDILETIT
jgi:glycosyltransferase involved in cell wall biosynthesis